MYTTRKGQCQCTIYNTQHEKAKCNIQCTKLQQILIKEQKNYTKERNKNNRNKEKKQR